MKTSQKAVCFCICFVISGLLFSRCGQENNPIEEPRSNDSSSFKQADEAPVIQAPTNIAVGKARILAGGIVLRMVSLDDEVVNNISGRATGLSASDTYVAQMFDAGSVATGENACQPTIFDSNDPGYLIDQQLIGFFDSGGNVAHAYQGSDYVAIDKIGTMSLERVISTDPLVTEFVGCARFTWRPPR